MNISSLKLLPVSWFVTTAASVVCNIVQSLVTAEFIVYCVPLSASVLVLLSTCMCAHAHTGHAHTYILVVFRVES